MPDGIRLLVVTPESRLLERENLTWVRAKLVDGEIGILARHAPLLAETVDGALRYGNGEEAHVIRLYAGILKVSREGVTVFTSGMLETPEDEAPPKPAPMYFKRLTGHLLNQEQAGKD
jgi:F-type H+-transporting ATPase subunit epsilon